TNSRVRSFKGEVLEVVGADIDPCVLKNPELDVAVLIDRDRLPLDDASFDLVISDYVLEHVEHPTKFFAEIYRVLRPGGNYFFRTPNIYHYVTLISLMTPHWLHMLIANRVRRLSPDAHEPWPTWYRLNSRSRIRKLAHASGFTTMELRMVETEPSY